MRRSPALGRRGVVTETNMSDEQPGDGQRDEYQPSDFERSEEFVRVLNESARLLGQNRPGEAVDRLLPLHAAAPANADVAINLGGAYILQRRWNRAAEVLRRALVFNPQNSMLWTNLGAAELGALETSGPRQQQSAIDAYQKALAADPTAPNVHYHLGLIYAYRGQMMRAAAFFQRALEVNPADRDARRWLDRLDVMDGKQPAGDAQPGDGESHASSGPAPTGRGTAADGESPFSLN